LIRQELSYAEYWGYYWRVTSRHKIPGIFQWDRDLVDLILRSCPVSPGSRMLDLGCAGGDQAKVFAQKGYEVTGIDIVQSLLDFAVKEFEKEGLRGRFLNEDMRSIAYKGEFDLCTILSGTFGFFSDEENFALLEKVMRALRKGGYAFISYLSTEFCSKMKRERTWSEMEGGYSLREEWFDAPSGTYRSKTIHILLDGRIIEPKKEAGYNANEVIRCYGMREMENLVKESGFEIVDHLTRHHLGNPDYKAEAWEPRGWIALRKP
jgi:2-polyprenyl-3-methyl-5-hydroxy-6-metoxy-1,4-benzoquinol methylase